MPKNKTKKLYTIYAFHIPILILAGLFIFGATYFIENYKPQEDEVGSVLGKGNNNEKPSNKGNSQNKDEKGNKPVTSNNEDKGNKGSANADIHRQNVGKVVGNLKKVAAEEELIGNDEVSEELQALADNEEQEAEDVADAINKIENRSKWKTLIAGADYKNLGQLRSHLAQNTNTIRKLTQVQNHVQNQGSEQSLQEQLKTLMQERERIASVISEHEDDFGVLGWAFRLLNGYLGGNLEDDLDKYVEVPESTESTGSSETITGTTEPSATE